MKTGIHLYWYTFTKKRKLLPTTTTKTKIPFLHKTPPPSNLCALNWQRNKTKEACSLVFHVCFLCRFQNISIISHVVARLQIAPSYNCACIVKPPFCPLCAGLNNAMIFFIIASTSAHRTHTFDWLAWQRRTQGYMFYCNGIGQSADMQQGHTKARKYSHCRDASPAYHMDQWNDKYDWMKETTTFSYMSFSFALYTHDGNYRIPRCHLVSRTSLRGDIT